jgi:Big-like domain-containing protein/carboxypeptidase family protein
VRRLITLAVLATIAVILGCASAGQPPGGPERKTPPEILSISPDSGATNVGVKEVEFKFDEVVSDRPAGAATGELDQIFLVSPMDGAANVSWHRSRITVKPRKGFRANTAYRITMLPGLADLRGNVRKDGATILFSTGATFPPFSILGRVFDWSAGRPANGAFVEAISHPDTNLIYVTATDSMGSFDVGPLPAGTYTVRALIDANSNRTVDRNEKWDTTTAVVTTVRPVIELDAIERDSVPPVFDNIDVTDSVTISVTFDKPLDPAMHPDSTMLTVQKQDSSRIGIVSVALESAFQKARASRDSAHRADSLRADSARRPAAAPPASPATPARPPSPAVPVPGGQRAAPPPPKPKAPAPERTIIITVATPLAQNTTYRLTARGFKNLRGNAREVTRTFTVPKPAPPKPPADTTRRAPGDTTRRVPGDTTKPPAPRRPPG